MSSSIGPNHHRHLMMVSFRCLYQSGCGHHLIPRTAAVERISLTYWRSYHKKKLPYYQQRQVNTTTTLRKRPFACLALERDALHSLLSESPWRSFCTNPSAGTSRFFPLSWMIILMTTTSPTNTRLANYHPYPCSIPSRI